MRDRDTQVCRVSQKLIDLSRRGYAIAALGEQLAKSRERGRPRPFLLVGNFG
jgi:hypothetical protein